MKKVTWLLGLSLLLSGGNVMAQEDENTDPMLEKEIPGNQIQTVENLSGVMDYLENVLSDLKKTLSEKQKDVEGAQNTLRGTAKTITEDKTTLVDAPEKKEYDQFAASTVWDGMSFGNADIYYYSVVTKGNPLTGGDEAVVYYVAPSLKDEVETLVGEGKLEHLNLSVVTDYAKLNLTANINRIYIYYKDLTNSESPTIGTLTGATTSLASKNVALVAGSFLETLLDKIPQIEETKTVVKDNPQYKYWTDEVARLQGLTTPYVERIALAEKSLKSISIENDLVIADVNFADKTWPADYTIKGNYHVISGSGATGAALFNRNEGNIENLVVSTGFIAKTNTGVISNCIERVAVGNYATYNAAGTKKENIASLEDAAYELKDVYGYNIATKTVEKAAPTNRVYVAHYANATHKDVYDFKVNIDANGKVVYDKEKAKTNGFADGEMSLQNAVLYIDGVDANTKVEKNVALKVDGSSIYTCAEVEMTEGTGTSEFYIPLNFTATTLNYKRTVTKDMASVCFPFALTSDMKEKLGIKSYHQFKDVDATTNTMWFSERSSIEANSPAVITFASEGNTVDFSKYTGIQFTATTSNADLGSTNSNTGKRLFYGNYKATQKSDDLSQAHGNGAFVYGVQNGRLVKMASTAWLDQFRSYVVYEGDLTKENAAPSFRIGLLDENDNEIVTAVESVSADKNGSFKVMGGNNAIEVSTEKACDVKVYTVNGTLVKSVQVEAGNTSLPVKAGMYVVNGTKVIVK